jgi:hypothetical protein
MIILEDLKDFVKKDGLQTIAMIEVSFLLSGTTGTTTGQGDNQTIKLNIPNHTQLPPKEFMEQYPEIVDDTTRRFLDTLSKVADGVGQMLKTEETCVSQHLYSFGKETFLDGSLLPGCLKKAARILEDTNDILHTLDNKIATLHTGGHAAAQKGISWIVPYIHSLIEVYKTYKGCLKSDEVTGNHGYKQLTRLGTDPSQSAAIMCLLPSVFGGYPSLPFSEYIYRGHPDPCTGGLWSLTILAKSSLTARQILHYIKGLQARDTDTKQTKEGKRYIGRWRAFPLKPCRGERVIPRVG